MEISKIAKMHIIGESLKVLFIYLLLFLPPLQVHILVKQKTYCCSMGDCEKAWHVHTHRCLMTYMRPFVMEQALWMLC